jgi:hypothetical protein
MDWITGSMGFLSFIHERLGFRMVGGMGRSSGQVVHVCSGFPYNPRFGICTFFRYLSQLYAANDRCLDVVSARGKSTAFLRAGSRHF